jgi:all-trans-retinol 13,14-reductase
LTTSLAGLFTTGGCVRTGRTVTEIILDVDGRAAGVAHTAGDGSDRVIDSAPVLFGNAAPAVLAEALPPEARSTFEASYQGRPPSISLFNIALGLDRHPSELGFHHYNTTLIPDWVNSLADYAHSGETLAGVPGSRMPVVAIVCFDLIDSGLNPNGPHLVSVCGTDRVANWDGLDDQAYRAKRDAWLEAIVAGVDRSFRGFAAAVVQREMATAVTLSRYLNSPHGEVYGFAPEPPTGIPTFGSEKAVTTTVPGLWLASSYAGAGGFTGVMLAGMLAAQAAVKSRHPHLPSITVPI